MLCNEQNVLEHFCRGAADGAVNAVIDYEKHRSELWRDRPWLVSKTEDDKMSTKSRFAAAIKKKILWFTKRIAQVMHLQLQFDNHHSIAPSPNIMLASCNDMII
jgi:hypothetical protein